MCAERIGSQYGISQSSTARLAEAMVDARKGIPDEIFAELKRCFAVNEIVELVSLVGIMELACSLAEVFELDAD